MLAETIIASVTAITIAGTWLGLRFAEKTLRPEEKRDKKRDAAIELVRRSVAEDTISSRDRVKALLITEPESLPDDIRARAIGWINREKVALPVKLDTGPHKPGGEL